VLFFFFFCTFTIRHSLLLVLMLCLRERGESFPQSSDYRKGLGRYKRLEKGSTISLKIKREVVQSIRCKEIKELA